MVFTVIMFLVVEMVVFLNVLWMEQMRIAQDIGFVPIDGVGWISCTIVIKIIIKPIHQDVMHIINVLYTNIFI